MSNKKYDVIVADPPWSFSDSLSMSDVARGAEANYNLLTLKEIKELKIKDISNDSGAILALWVPSSLLQEGLDVMKSWGFSHKQTYIWVKTKNQPFKDFKKWINLEIIKKKQISYDKFSYLRAAKAIVDSLKNVNFNYELAFGMGRLFRQTHEICLIGINNTGIYKKLKNKSQRSVGLFENMRHSQKPELLQDSLDLMFPNVEKIEIFARRTRQGWTCLGNEVCNGEDIRESIDKL